MYKPKHMTEKLTGYAHRLYSELRDVGENIVHASKDYIQNRAYRLPTGGYDGDSTYEGLRRRNKIIPEYG